MSDFDFSPKYHTGNDLVDTQHKQLFELISQFFNAVGTGKPSENAVKTLANLVNYAKKHFVDEESLMRNRGYPKLLQHAALHNELAAKAGILLDQYAHQQLAATADVARFLNQWLINHILEHDLAMIHWIQENNKQS
jgi:hemerythrin